MPCLSTIPMDYLNSNAVFKRLEMYNIQLYVIAKSVDGPGAPWGAPGEFMYCNYWTVLRMDRSLI